MDTAGSKPANKGVPAPQEVLDPPPSRSLPLARKGLRTTKDIRRFGLAVAEDAILGAVPPKAASVAIGAVSLSLRAAQLEIRYAESFPQDEEGGINLLDSPKRSERDQKIEAMEKELAEMKASRGKVNEIPGGTRNE